MKFPLPISIELIFQFTFFFLFFTTAYILSLLQPCSFFAKKKKNACEIILMKVRVACV